MAATAGKKESPLKLVSAIGCICVCNHFMEDAQRIQRYEIMGYYNTSERHDRFLSFSSSLGVRFRFFLDGVDLEPLTFTKVQCLSICVSFLFSYSFLRDCRFLATT